MSVEIEVKKFTEKLKKEYSNGVLVNINDYDHGLIHGLASENFIRAKRDLCLLEGQRDSWSIAEEGNEGIPYKPRNEATIKPIFTFRSQAKRNVPIENTSISIKNPMLLKECTILSEEYKGPEHLANIIKNSENVTCLFIKDINTIMNFVLFDLCHVVKLCDYKCVAYSTTSRDIFRSMYEHYRSTEKDVYLLKLIMPLKYVLNDYVSDMYKTKGVCITYFVGASGGISDSGLSVLVAEKIDGSLIVDGTAGVFGVETNLLKLFIEEDYLPFIMLGSSAYTLTNMWAVSNLENVFSVKQKAREL